MTLISCLPAAQRVSLRYLSVNHELLITVEDDHNGTVSCDDKDQDAFELLMGASFGFFKNSWLLEKTIIIRTVSGAENGCVTLQRKKMVVTAM